MTITLSGRRRRGVLAAFVLVISIAAVIATSGQSSLASSDEGSDADGPAALEGRHLYLVPDTPEGAVATEVVNARVVARYESFSLVSADGSAHEALRLAGADRRDDMRSVGTAAGALDPPRRRSLAAGSSETLALVQFVGPVKDAWLERLRGTGATIITYMAQNAYLAYASGAGAAALSKLAADDAVRAVVPFTAADKAAPGIAESGIANVAVETLAGAPGAAAREILAGGDELQPPAAFGGTSTRFAAIDADRIDELAADPAVVSVEPWVAPKLLDERAAEIVRGRLNAAGTVPVGPGYLSFLNNQGFPATTLPFAIDVTDEGIDRGLLPPPPGSHNDFFVNGNAAGATRISLPPGIRGGYGCTRLRRSRHQRRLDRGRLQHPDRSCPRGRPGIQLRARHRAAGAPREHEDLPLRGRLRSRRVLCDPALERLRPGRPGLEQLLGRERRWRLQLGLAHSRLPRPRRSTGDRGQPADDERRLGGQRWLRRQHPRGPGDGEERDHRRRVRERSRRRCSTAAVFPTQTPTTPRTSSTSPAAGRPTTDG